MRPKIKESDLSGSIEEYLRPAGWEVWKEVLLLGGSVADIVARKGIMYWNIELKTSLSLSVMFQAFDNRRFFHLSSVFTLNARPNAGRAMAEDFLRRYGLGLMVIGRYNLDADQIKEIIRPKLNKHAAAKSLELHESQKAGKAGLCSGTHETPFKRTVQALVDYVKRNPGTPLKRAIENIPYHYKAYSTAYSCLGQYIPGIITELEWRNGGLYIA
jgi:hypothetical protein